MSARDNKKTDTGKTAVGAAIAIDWSEVKRRVKATGDALANHGVTDEERKKTLKERTMRLAAPEAAPETGAWLDTVEFVLAHERYAVESRFVREICPMHELTPVPCTPAFVLGIINVRGQILSVIDIKKFFALPERGITDLNKVIILTRADMTFGVIADAIIGVKRVKNADIEAALPTLTGIRAEYLRGVTRERLVIIDAEKLLMDKGVIVEQSVEA